MLGPVIVAKHGLSCVSQVFIGWMQVLSTCASSDSFDDAACRFDVMSAILIAKECKKWSDLRFAEDPAAWEDASLLEVQELLRKVMEVGVQEPRPVCSAHAQDLVCQFRCLLVGRSPKIKRARVVAEELQDGVVCKGSLVQPRARGAEGVGPRAASKRLGAEAMGVEDKRLWLENARLASIIGTCRLSMPSVMSGLRCWISFVGGFFCFP